MPISYFARPLEINEIRGRMKPSSTVRLPVAWAAMACIESGGLMSMMEIAVLG